MRKITDLNFEDLKEVALKRATSKTYFAILLIILSLVAAVAITGKANRSVEMWSPKTNLVEGDLLSQENLEIVRVFLPDNLPSAGIETIVAPLLATGAAAATGAGVETWATGAGVATGVGVGVGVGVETGAAAFVAPLDSAIIANSAPTATVESTCTTIFCNTPATGAGISVSTLSVETSNNGSSTAI